MVKITEIVLSAHQEAQKQLDDLLAAKYITHNEWKKASEEAGYTAALEYTRHKGIEDNEVQLD